MEQHYPIDQSVPGNKGYSGQTDLDENINSYYRNMLMMGVSDAMVCRVFYSTLTRRAADWFKNLEPGSISSFFDLARKFIHRFAMSKAVKKHFTYLDKSKQREGEPSLVFIERWKIAMGEIELLDDGTVINVLHASLRAGSLYQDFILRPPLTYEEVVRRVIDHANAMEANSAKRQQETGSHM